MDTLPSPGMMEIQTLPDGSIKRNFTPLSVDMVAYKYATEGTDKLEPYFGGVQVIP